MRPRITVITLGVDDLERSLRFYRDGLGLPTEGIIGEEFEYGAVVFFDLQSGIKLALWPRQSIAKETGLPVGTANPCELSLGHNVASRQEVDEVMALAKRAGAPIVKEAQQTFWGGYAGYFQDPDQHLWEVVWNPQLLPVTPTLRKSGAAVSSISTPSTSSITVTGGWRMKRWKHSG